MPKIPNLQTRLQIPQITGLNLLNFDETLFPAIQILHMKALMKLHRLVKRRNRAVSAEDFGTNQHVH